MSVSIPVQGVSFSSLHCRTADSPIRAPILLDCHLDRAWPTEWPSRQPAPLLLHLTSSRYSTSIQLYIKKLRHCLTQAWHVLAAKITCVRLLQAQQPLEPADTAAQLPHGRMPEMPCPAPSGHPVAQPRAVAGRYLPIALQSNSTPHTGLPPAMADFHKAL